MTASTSRPGSVSAPGGAVRPVVLAAHEHNPGGGRDALVLHGLGSDGATTWRLCAALAGEGHRVLAPDLRGHGASPPAGSYALAAHVADVARLGDGWDVVVGHSLGGAVLAHLLARPGYAGAALLLDPVLRLGSADLAVARAELLDDIGRYTPDEVAAANPRWDREDVERKATAALRVTPRVVERTLDETDWDLVARAADWTCPVRVLAADPARGAMVDPELAAALHQPPQVVVETIDGSGHSVHRDAPDRVIAVLREIAGAAPGPE